MTSSIRAVGLWLVPVVLLAACMPSAATPSSGSGPQAPSSSAPKRITAAIISDPAVLNTKINPGTVVTPGHEELERVLNVGLAIVDDQGTLRGLLAETLPTVENGLWRVLPDGRMETSFRLRSGVQWHDGAPLSANDVAFTSRAEQDRELPIRRDSAYEWVESVEAPDTLTVTVRWKRPYIQADWLFNSSAMLPAHLLEKTYTEDKAAFPNLSFWTHDFVGAGPFKLREFVRGSHIVASANLSYFLGRPKVDEVEVKFIPDINTLLANVLAGTVDVTMGRGIAIEQAIQTRDQWIAGGMDMAFRSWIVMYPQFINPTPPIVANLQLRRALLHAIDRQEMADSIQAGLVPVAHAFLNPREPDYKAVEGSITRYEYDPVRATQLIEGLGYRKGADGVLRDVGSQRLLIEPWTTAETAIHMKALFPAADFWQRIGVAVEPQVLPAQRAQDREYRANFPSFLLWRQPNDLASLRRHQSTQAPLAENNYVGTNNARYVNTEWDALIDRLYTTIPKTERTPVLAQLVRHMTENLNVLGLFYDTEPSFIAHRLKNLAPSRADGSNMVWNAQEWDIK